MRSAPTWFEYLEARFARIKYYESDTVQIDMREFRVHQPIEVVHTKMTPAQRVMFGIFGVQV